MAKSKRLAKLVATLLDGARADQRWRALDAERVAKISELTAKMDEARSPDPWSVRRILDLKAQNEELLALDGQRVAKIQEMAALDAQRVAKIEELVALDAERVAQVSDLMWRSGMDRPLAFMHIPKTAGTSLTDGLRAVMPATACIGGLDRSMLGTFSAVETLAPAIRGMIHYDGIPPALGSDFVAGHFAYSTLAQARPTARFMTVLREPRSRLLSLWSYWRTQSTDDSWLGVFRLSRPSFVDFLKRVDAACMTDNAAVRMLLWPHPLIPDGDFIDDASDQRIADEAATRLIRFDFADVIENPRFQENVRSLVVRAFLYCRVNETQVPPEIRAPLHDEFTGEALHLLERRCRLDRMLWLALARERMPGVDAVTLADDIFRKAVARHAELMAA